MRQTFAIPRDKNYQLQQYFKEHVEPGVTWLEIRGGDEPAVSVMLAQTLRLKKRGRPKSKDSRFEVLTLEPSKLSKIPPNSFDFVIFNQRNAEGVLLVGPLLHQAARITRKHLIVHQDGLNQSEREGLLAQLQEVGSIEFEDGSDPKNKVLVVVNLIAAEASDGPIKTIDLWEKKRMADEADMKLHHSQTLFVRKARLAREARLAQESDVQLQRSADEFRAEKDAIAADGEFLGGPPSPEFQAEAQKDWGPLREDGPLEVAPTEPPFAALEEAFAALEEGDEGPPSPEFQAEAQKDWESSREFWRSRPPRPPEPLARKSSVNEAFAALEEGDVDDDREASEAAEAAIAADGEYPPGNTPAPPLVSAAPPPVPKVPLAKPKKGKVKGKAKRD